MSRPNRPSSQISRETAHAHGSGLVPELDSVCADDDGPKPVAGPARAGILTKPRGNPWASDGLAQEPATKVCPVRSGLRPTRLAMPGWLYHGLSATPPNAWQEANSSLHLGCLELLRLGVPGSNV